MTEKGRLMSRISMKTLKMRHWSDAAVSACSSERGEGTCVFMKETSSGNVSMTSSEVRLQQCRRQSSCSRKSVGASGIAPISAMRSLQ